MIDWLIINIIIVIIIIIQIILRPAFLTLMIQLREKMIPFSIRNTAPTGLLLKFITINFQEGLSYYFIS